MYYQSQYMLNDLLAVQIIWYEWQEISNLFAFHPTANPITQY